jgi:hypothetical protein
VLLVLDWVEPRWARLRLLRPFAVLAMVGSLVFAWMCDAVGDHDGITALDGPVSPRAISGFFSRRRRRRSF